MLAKVVYSTCKDLTRQTERCNTVWDLKCCGLPRCSEICSTCKPTATYNKCAAAQWHRGHGTGDTLRCGLLPLQYKTWWSCLEQCASSDMKEMQRPLKRGERTAHWLARTAFFLRCHDALQGALLKQVLTSIFPICAVTSSETSQHPPQR